MNYKIIPNITLKISTLLIIFIFLIQTNTHISPIMHKDIQIKTTNSFSPYNYYKMHVFITKNDNWDSNTYYYGFLKNSNDTFFDKTIYIEDIKLTPDIFKKYNILAFAKPSDYSLTLESYSFLDALSLELTLKESAIYEDFNKVEGCMAFGGIFLIPKNQTIENIDFYTIENSITDDYIIHKDSDNYIDNYYTNYSEKLIDNNMFKNLGFIPYDDFHMKLITNENDLTNTIKGLELNKEIDILESDSKKYFSYRNILLCAKNSNGTFYCKPTVTKDFYYQDVWSTQSLKIKEYLYNSNQKEYITYYSFITLPKKISINNIKIEKNYLNYKNFDDNKMKLTYKDAEKIAQIFFNTSSSLSSSSDLQIIKLLSKANSKEDTDNSHFRRMWYFRNKYHTEIYIDATTGKVIQYHR